jgi:TolB-like protein
LGDVVEESDGDLMGDGVNIAARLEGIAKPGAIFLSEDAYRQVKSRLDLAVSDLGPTQLKNITEPIRVYSLQVGAPAQAKPATEAKPLEPKKRSARALLAVVAVLLILIAAGAWYFLGVTRTAPVASGAPTAPGPAHLSMAVLPFTNLSNDPSQDYFADGITENLTTDLSRIRNSFVIARNTAFTFKGKNTDVKEIGKQLGVRYVLEGSVQRDQNRVRVNAQLIDAETGAHLWADRFEEDVADVFKLQDQVVARLANTLGYELVKAEAGKSTHSGNPDAIDLTMRGWAILNQVQLAGDQESRAKAFGLFEQALKVDPNNVDALVGAAIAEWRLLFYSGMGVKSEQITKIDDLLANALRIDPTNARAYVVRGNIYGGAMRIREAAEAAQNAVRLNPNYAPAYAMLAQEQVLTPAEYPLSIANINQAMKLSPRDPEMGRWHWIKGRTLNYMGRHQDAIREEQAALDNGFSLWVVYEHLAVAYALLGRQSEAEAAVAQARKVNPKFNIKWFRDQFGPPESTYEGLRTVYDGLRKAGLPEE